MTSTSGLRATLTAPIQSAIVETSTSTPDIAAFFDGYAARGDKVDVVVFSAPQLSLLELREVAELLEGRRVHPEVSLLVATSPENKSGVDRMGLTRRIEDSGALMLSGICFYQSYAREMAEANGWKRLMTNSAKLVNIIGGYGYAPTLGSMAACVDSAICGTCAVTTVLTCHRGLGRTVRGIALVADDNFFRPLRSRPRTWDFLAGRRTGSMVEATSLGSSC